MAGTYVRSTTHQRSMSDGKSSAPPDWPSFWVETAKRYCLKQGISENRFHNCEEKLLSFFAGHQCHPRKITPDKIRDFLITINRNDHYLFDDIYQVIEMFYSSLEGKYPEITRLQLEAIRNFSAKNSDELIGMLINYLKLNKFSKHTINNYSSAVRKYLSHLERNPSSGDRREIESYLLRLSNNDHLAPRTVNLASAAISIFYEFIINDASAVKDIPRMKPGKSLPKVYGQGDLDKILNCVHNEKHQLVIMIVYGLGLRLNEIRNLKVSDIDWDRKIIRIRGKGSKERDLPLDECMVAPLNSYLSKNPDLIYLFEGLGKGKAYPERTIQKIYENACRKSGVLQKGGIHSMRHSYATHLLEAGVDINKIKTLLGHSSIKTTQIYTYVSKEEIAKIRSPLASLNVIKRNGV